MKESQIERLVREMGLSRKEFFRTLPAVVENLPSKIEENRITIGWSQGSVVIDLGPETDRKLGSLALPTMNVEFQFIGLNPSDREGFLAHFDRYFQRGGG